MVDRWNAGPFDWTLTFTPAPICGDPDALAAGNVTSTTADLSWTAPAFGTPTDYNWEVQPTGITQGTPSAYCKWH